MFFLNLTAGEFFALLSTLGGVITLLYLLDRAQRKRVVSTMRFWLPALTVEQRQSRRRMHEPWSLVLQLLSLLLLLLAIGELQWGSRGRRGRDHVLLLDTSAWSAERMSQAAAGAGQGTLLDQEKRQARQYIAALPANDRVLLVRAGSLTLPATPFTSDRARLAQAIDESQPGYASLNAEQAIAYAHQAQAWSGRQPGEIVYVGPQLVSEQNEAAQSVGNLRILSVPANREHCGIRHLAVKHASDGAWQALLTVKNYGGTRRTVHLRTQFAGTAFAVRTLALNPGQEVGAEYKFLTNVAGQLVASLEPADDLTSDSRAVLELPRNAPLRVAVFTDRPDALKPLLAPDHSLNVQFLNVAEYKPRPDADIAILDRFCPLHPPAIPSLWIQPPAGHSPLPVKTKVSQLAVKEWNPETALSAGLRTRELPVSEAEVFQTFDADTVVASAPEGPVIVGRPAHPDQAQLAVIGFDPLAGELRFEITTPLLFANMLRWLSPAAFQRHEIIAGQVGTTTLPLDSDEHGIRVTDESGASVPFTIRDHTLELFVSRPTIIHISSEGHDRIASLTLPDVGAYPWQISTASQGLPVSGRFAPSAVDLWKWLAILGATGLLLEWMLFGPRVRVRRRAASAPARRGNDPAAGREKELVSR
ncbi:MAG: VWA domain-containing protein [Acidobacteriaceae bacterium]|nr:VWA domain-containing protein [Acidobacteriaceae bacterium]